MFCHSELDLGTLKMLTLVRFRDVYYNQQSISLFLAWYDSSQPVFTVNVQYLPQIFAIYKY